jgi:hypothetical protein
MLEKTTNSRREMKTTRKSKADHRLDTPVCTHCGQPLDPELIKRLAGHFVGSIKGKRKARTPEQARKAALVRWAKRSDA